MFGLLFASVAIVACIFFVLGVLGSVVGLKNENDIMLFGAIVSIVGLLVAMNYEGILAWFEAITPMSILQLFHLGWM